MASAVSRVDEQVRDRADALERARVSSRLEGVDLDPAAAALAQRYVVGELSSEDLVEEMVRLPL